MASLIPTDVSPVRRVAVPHRELTPGEYFIEWEGWTLPVTVIKGGRYIARSGYTHSIDTVPTAKFYRMPPQLT